MNDLVRAAFAAFLDDLSAPPSVTLRGGDALDDHAMPAPFDPALDAITDDYLHRYRWGIGFLDPPSWRHYLPHLIEHAVRHQVAGSDVIDCLLERLRPPDTGRLSALTTDQEAVVVQLLDSIAFSETSPHSAQAQAALEEWWAPGALYRPG